VNKRWPCWLTPRKVWLSPEKLSATMRTLFDQSTPAPLRQFLAGHDVATVYEHGWSTLDNGELLAAVENAGFELFITTDQNLRYQQNLTGRRLSFLVLPTTRWPQIERHIAEITAAVDSMRPGEYHELKW